MMMTVVARPAISVVLLFAVVQRSMIFANGILPETALSTRFVLMGEYTKWEVDGNAIRCNYSTQLDSGSLSTTPVETNDEGRVVFNLPGQYYHQCPLLNNETGFDMNETGFRVVSTQHKVAVCTNDNCTKELSISVGDVVYWSLLEVDGNCTTIDLVASTCSGNLLQRYIYYEMSGLQEGYYFNQQGVYHLYCATTVDRQCQQEALLTIKVEDTISSSDKISYSELIYSHAGVMAVTFGMILPAGALLANYKLVVPHIILQICGQLLSLIGFILVIIYTQLNKRQHFDQIHSILGLILVIVVIVVQPILKLLSLKFVKKQSKVWHKRVGIAAVFFGLSNVLLGMLLLGTTPLSVKILYGIWLLFAMAVYVLCGSVSRSDDGGDNQDKYGMSNNAVYSWKSKGDRISLSPPTAVALGPSKLSKEVINEKSFIQIRKKSIDVLESPYNTNTNVMSNSTGNTTAGGGGAGRQRKISNVHFGPVNVAEQLSPPPATPNNISTTNFGFGEKRSKYTDESDDSNDKGEEETTTEDEESGNECNSGNSSAQEETDQKQGGEVEDMNKSLESISSLPSQGGSVRITRHSSRAYTKASEIFQRSNSFSRPNHLAPSISINSDEPLITPQHEYPRFSPTAETPMSGTSDDDHQLQVRSLTRSANSDSVLPLQQRRQRRTGMEMQVPRTADNLSIGRVTPIRSPSRSPSFSRKRRDMLVDNTLRSVMQMSDDAIISANAQGEIVFWSSGAMKIFGYTPGEAIGSSLQMVMPQRYKEKHQNGVNRRTEYALDYIKKHNTAPEEQKHARLYAVHGVSKSGREFGVEVVVSSFVVEGEIFYTGIITETDKGLTRQMSATSLNSEAEIREKQQKAIAIGTQMKIAHKLRSAEYITKNELQNILGFSLKASEFEVPADDLSKMVDGIIQAADPDERGVIRFTELIDLLAKHRLYISDSGVIAKYGKSKAEGNLNCRQQASSKLASFFARGTSSIVWMSIYLIISVMLLLGGVLSTDRDNNGWQQFAYGSGPLLSFNCVLILLLAMKGVVHSLRGNAFIVKTLPLQHNVKFHVFFCVVAMLLSVVHTIAHLCSFAVSGEDSNGTSSGEDFLSNLETSTNPLITGFIIYLVVIVTLLVSSLPMLRQLCHFVGFYCIHWGTAALFYFLLVIHANNHFNLSFWKWLLPVLLVFILDRIYTLVVIRHNTVDVCKAFVYDETSRTTFIEIQKPKRFKFTPGQYIQLNIPQIGYFNWQSCKISSSNKEQNLKVYLPHSGNLWLKKCFQNFKANPLNPKPKEGKPEIEQPPITGYISGPFGCGVNPLFNYQAAMLVCGNTGPNISRSLIQSFLEYRRSNSCHCGCHPTLTKLYFIWIIPSGNDFEWFTDFLSDIIEDKHIQRYLDIRIYLTNINSPPDELASALLHLALKTGGPALSVKRPSQPQLSKLHSNTSYGTPDFESLLDFISIQQGTSSDQEVECGVFTMGDIPYSMEANLQRSCRICSKKKGPTTSKEMDMSSPYRRKISTSEDNSPSPPVETPKEWHITFQLQQLAV